MNILRFFRGGSSAPVARERLRILLKHERGSINNRSELITMLRKDVLAAVAKNISINPEQVQMNFHREGNAVSVQIEIELKTRSVKTSARTPLDTHYRPGSGFLHVQ